MTLPKHFFCSSSGELFDTRHPAWSARPLRPCYRQHRAVFDRDPVKASIQARAAIRAGSYAWPGGYPVALTMGDGGLVCMTCAQLHWGDLARDHRYAGKDESARFHGLAVFYSQELDDEGHTVQEPCDLCGRDVLTT